jgi:1,4-alpha-glucan branching enzyme
LVCVSDFVRRRDVEKVHFSADRALVIYNGVDLMTYAPVPAEQDGHRLTIAFIGQLIPEKGVLTLLRAVQRLRDSIPAFQLLLAGRGPQEEELREFCRTAGLTDRVRFLGQIDWVPRLLSNADVVVIPSEWQEACSFAVIESLACGACVLASDAGGTPEIIGEGGVAGVIFRKGDADDLAEKLSALLVDQARRTQMRIAARQRAVQCFSIERMVEEHAAVIDGTIARASAARRS